MAVFPPRSGFVQPPAPSEPAKSAGPVSRTVSKLKEMSEYLNRAKQYHNAIRKILMDDWDPIGVKGIQEASDEYDLYISRIYKLLIHNESEDSIFRYLCEIETNYMELSGDRNVTESVSKKLVTLRNTIENNC